MGCLLRWVSKGIRGKRVRKKEYSPQMEKKKEIFYIQQFTFSFFSPTPCEPFCSPKMTLTKKGKCTEGKEDGNNGSLLGMCQIKVWGSHEIIGSIFLSFFLSTVQAHTRKRCGKNVWKINQCGETFLLACNDDPGTETQHTAGRIIARECVPPHHQIACGRGIFFFFLQYFFFHFLFLKPPWNSSSLSFPDDFPILYLLYSL